MFDNLIKFVETNLITFTFFGGCGAKGCDDEDMADDKKHFQKVTVMLGQLSVSKIPAKEESRLNVRKDTQIE